MFFDPILSGNRDIACATCHFPTLGTGDGLALPIGTGSDTPGIAGDGRIKGDGREFVPRNAPEVFNRGSILWQTQFWDGRIAEDGLGGIISPAGLALPASIDRVLAAQAMFPITSRDEMRGSEEDALDPSLGNELAAIADDDFVGIWDGVMARLASIPEYVNHVRIRIRSWSGPAWTMPAAANAIAAFEEVAFGMDNSPFDLYVGGDTSAMTDNVRSVERCCSTPRRTAPRATAGRC